MHESQQGLHFETSVFGPRIRGTEDTLSASVLHLVKQFEYTPDGTDGLTDGQTHKTD